MSQQQQLNSSFTLQHQGLAMFGIVPVNPAVSTTSLAMTSSTTPRIDRVNGATGKLIFKCDEPASISVDIIGSPKPTVTWHIGRRRVKESANKYQLSVDGKRHTLTVTNVTDELESGIWIMARNEAGEDNCLIAVKTYKVLFGHQFSFSGFRETTPAPEVVLLQRSATVRSQLRRPESTGCLNVSGGSAMSLQVHQHHKRSGPTQNDWQREMAARNQMRSVDDLPNYKPTWRIAKKSDITNASLDRSRDSMSGSNRSRRIRLVRRNRSCDVSQSSLVVDVDQEQRQTSSLSRDDSRTRRDDAVVTSDQRQSRSGIRRQRSSSASRTAGVDGLTDGRSVDGSQPPTLKTRSSSVDRPRRKLSAAKNSETSETQAAEVLTKNGVELRQHRSTRTSSKTGSASGALDSARQPKDSSVEASAMELDQRARRPPTGRLSKPAARKSTIERDNVWHLFGMRLDSLCHNLLARTLTPSGMFLAPSEVPPVLADDLVDNGGMETEALPSGTEGRRHLTRLPSSATDADVTYTVLPAVEPIALEDVVQSSTAPTWQHVTQLEYKTSYVSDLDGQNGDRTAVLVDIESTDGTKASYAKQPLPATETNVDLLFSTDDVVSDSIADGNGNMPFSTNTNASNLADIATVSVPDNMAPICDERIYSILTQTVDLQKIINTVDQLVGDSVSSDHSPSNSLSPSTSGINAFSPILTVDGPRKTLPPVNSLNSKNVQHPAIGSGKRVPDVVSDLLNIDDPGDDDEWEDLDVIESFNCDSILSGGVDFSDSCRLPSMVDTDQDDADDFAAEYERDIEIFDLGLILPGRKARPVLLGPRHNHQGGKGVRVSK